MRFAAAAVALAALSSCGGRDASRTATAAAPAPRPAPAPSTVAAPPPERAPLLVRTFAPPVPPRRAPHGGAIERVAVAGSGDAALTLDTLGEVRLWPALDGTAEPVAVTAPGAAALAVARLGGGLAVGIAELAGGAQIQRFDRTGALIARMQLPLEPAVEQLAFAGELILARRADQTIAAYTLDGTPRGQVAAGRSEQLTELAVRGGRAVVGIDRQGPGTRGRALAVRRLDPPLSEHAALAWGDTYELPQPLAALALAPSGRRIAGVTEQHVGHIVELADGRGLVVGVLDAAKLRSDRTTIGFLTDARVSMSLRGADLGATLARDGWQPEPRSITRGFFTDARAAYGDGVAIAAVGAALMIDGGAPRAFLGYQSGTPHRFATGEVIGGLYTGGAIAWMDEQLQPRRFASAPTISPRSISVREVAGASWRPGGSYRVTVTDLATKREVELVTLPRTPRLDYDRTTRVLAITDFQRVVRFRVPDAGPAVQLSGTTVEVAALSSVIATDPQRAGGVVAVGVAPRWADLYTAPTDTARVPLVRRARIEVPPGHAILHVDRAARLYTTNHQIVQVRRGDEVVTELRLPLASAVLTNTDASAVAIKSAQELAVFDIPSGRERWRRRLDVLRDLAWTPEGRVAVAVPGGLFSFDAATGARFAAVCGWRFGLEPTLPSNSNAGVPSPCLADD